jgi:hypothetical protein
MRAFGVSAAEIDDERFLGRLGEVWAACGLKVWWWWEWRPLGMA